MKLSDRDLKLIIILLIALVLALPYIFIAKPTQAKIKQEESEIQTLQTRYDYLLGLNAQRQYYLDETARLSVERGNIINLFPAGINTENVIMFIQDTEFYIPMWVKSVVFGINQNTPISEAKSPDEEGLTAIENTARLSYECAYDDFKFFLEYIKNYDDRMVLRSVSMRLSDIYPAEEGIIEGDVTLAQYAISGEGRVYPEADIPVVPHGSENIFVGGDDIIEADENPDGENPENTEQQTENVDYDFFVRVNPNGTEEGTKIVGKGGDVSGDSWITNKANSEQSALITFTEEDGIYRVSYKVGTTKYPTKDYSIGEEFTPVQDSIILNVFSSERVDEKDAVGLKMRIVNETNLDVNLNIIGDDSVNPRITVTDTKGNVNVSGLVEPGVDSE